MAVKYLFYIIACFTYIWKSHLNRIGVNDACIIDVGKNIVSVGRDGQAKLYDVGESKCLSTIAKYNTIINACSIQSLSDENLQKLEINSIPEEEAISKIFRNARNIKFIKLIKYIN